MIRAPFAGNSVYAKIHILNSKRLSPEDYKSLASCRTVGEAADKLKNMESYSGILSSVPTINISRTHLEVLLHSKVYEDINSLSTYAKSIGDDFYRYFIYEYDMAQLRNCIACLNTRTESYMMRLPSFYEEMSYLDLFAIARANSIDEIAEMCEKTPYASCMKQTAKIYKENGDLTRCFVPVYAFMEKQFIELLGGRKKLKHHKKLCELYSNERDLEILKVLFRVKRFSGERSFSAELPHFEMTRFSDKQLRLMGDAESIDELKQIVSSTEYSSVLDNFDGKEFEKCADELLYKRYCDAMMYDTDSDELLFVFAGMKQIEMQNIIHIVEGIRYKLPPDEIEQMICGYSPQG